MHDASVQAVQGGRAAATSAPPAPAPNAAGALPTTAASMPPASSAADGTPAASSHPQPVPATDPAAPQPAVVLEAFAVIETTTGQSARSDGEAYAGPVTFLQRQFI